MSDEYLRKLMKERPVHEDFEDGRCDACNELGGHYWRDGLWLCRSCIEADE